MKKTALVLAVIMAVALAFTACADNRPDSEKIIGTWETEIDMTEKLQESMALVGEVKIDSFKFDLSFNFKEGGAYTVEIDEESFKSAFESIKPALVTALETTMKAMAETYGVSLDEMLEGKTLDEYLDSAINVDDMGDQLKSEGKYKIEEGKLFIAGKDAEISDDTYFTYEFSGSDLVLKDRVGEADEDDSINEILVFPLTLKKK